MKQYLLSSSNIASDDKRYTMNFCKKTEYLNHLRETVVQDVHEYVSTGYGNVNSQICFIFDNEQTFEIVKPFVQDILDKFHISFWSIYVTFVDKTTNEYSKKIPYIANEINAVNPNLIYFVVNQEKTEELIVDELERISNKKPERFFYVDIKELSSSEEETRRGKEI